MSRERHHAPSPMTHEPITARPLQTLTVDELPQPGSPAIDQGHITVISGAHLQTFPIAGLSVEQARTLLDQLMSLHPEAPMLVNGSPVGSGYELQTGDTLEFVHHAGEKGHGSWTMA